MCGNFGLLLYNKQSTNQNKPIFKPIKPINELDRSLDRSLHMVSSINGLRINNNLSTNSELLKPIEILKSQTSATEIRGGQAGGFSSFIYNQIEAQSLYESQFNQVASYEEPIVTRVRCVARKRHPLANDLSDLYISNNPGTIRSNDIVSVIGHTRFATSSINEVPELHPHEWTPSNPQSIWQFNRHIGRFECKELKFVVHITHNGDFDALDCYSQSVENKELGFWLERVLHYPNQLKGDSPKIAGCLELMRVQGSWFAASRLAWVRCVLATINDVSGNGELSSNAPNTFPSNSFFMKWSKYLDIHWRQHVNNIIEANYVSNVPKSKSTYAINRKAEKLLVKTIIDSLTGVGSIPFFENNQMDITLDLIKEQLASLNLSIHNSLNGNQASKHSYEQQIPTNSLFRIKKALGIDLWSRKILKSFVTTCVYHFLRADLYNAMTELLARATGSFGLQAHCTIEPGVVVIASKGQPMSIAFDPNRPICLFASEAGALAVPIDKEKNWLPERIDLDSHGEIMRIGEPRALCEGKYNYTSIESNNEAIIKPNDRFKSMYQSKSQAKQPTNYPTNYPITSDALDLLNDRLSVHEKFSTHSKRSDRSNYLDLSDHSIGYPPIYPPNYQSNYPSNYLPNNLTNYPTNNQSTKPSNHIINQTRLQLDSGIEISSYSLRQRCESSIDSLLSRCVSVTSTCLPYDPSIDLVAEDLKATPAVLNMINIAWDNPKSIERISAKALANCLTSCMSTRLSTQLDTIDLLVGGVEVSLWIAEQWATDLRAIFPQLKIVTISANKLLCLGNENPEKVFFPGSDSIDPRQIDSNTCGLLISQSGQTFPTLHATKVLTQLLGDRLWLLTGCFDSKIEQILIESYKDRLGDNQSNVYIKDRVFNNYSGHRPSEPSSVAVAATWHTLTRLFLEIVNTTRSIYPGGCILHPWQYDQYARIIQRFIRSIIRYKRSNRSSYQSKLSIYLSINLTKQQTNNLTNKLTSNLTNSLTNHSTSKHKNILMLLSDGCISDIKSLTSNIVYSVSYIVGYDINQLPLQLDTQRNSKIDSTDTKEVRYMYLPYHQLVAQGKAWAEHVNEPWSMLVLAGLYIYLSVGLGLPICGLIADLIVYIIRSAGADIGSGVLEFTPRTPHIMYNQNVGFTLIGLIIQLLDAMFFIYLAKNFTYLSRYLSNRPLHARHGRRTIVIVDNPAVHQLVEIFVSKLYSQSYSIVGVDVHGASGMDHFVHRFTHRVVRGLLIAVGRPDGRLTCLAKSESAVLLSTKQAAFIRNPDYYSKLTGSDGSGPEIVTIGHSSYSPNLGVSHHIQLEAIDKNLTIHRRKQFLDEYLFNRLYQSTKPFTLPIIRSLARQYQHIVTVDKKIDSKLNSKKDSKLNSKKDSKLDSKINTEIDRYIDKNEKIDNQVVVDLLDHNSSFKFINNQLTNSSYSKIANQLDSNMKPDCESEKSIDLPYGIHHINPTLAKNNPTSPMLLDLILQSKDLLRNRKKDNKKDNTTDSKIDEKTISKIDSNLDSNVISMVDSKLDSLSDRNSNPATRLAFISKLDSQARNLIDLQVMVQQFYECRIASLERYLAFCVMFHSMAAHSSRPWLREPWDIARSQSNLRVATTAAPVGSQVEEEGEISKEAKLLVKQFIAKIRGYDVTF